MKRILIFVLVFALFMNVSYRIKATETWPDQDNEGKGYMLIDMTFGRTSGYEYYFTNCEYVTHDGRGHFEGRVSGDKPYKDVKMYSRFLRNGVYDNKGIWVGSNSSTFTYSPEFIITSSSVPLVDYNTLSTIIEPVGDNRGIPQKIDKGYTYFNDEVTQKNSVLDNTVPYIKKFKVSKNGVGALATHYLNWETSDDVKKAHVEIAFAYKVEASNSWFLDKKYNENFAFYRTYGDNLLSSALSLKVPLSTSDPDGSFKDSVTTCIVKDLQNKFGQAEAMAIMTAKESNLKAYYIRNVVLVNGVYHYSKWVRCEVGKAYSVGNVGVVGQDGTGYENTDDYEIINGKPTTSGDIGQTDTGFFGSVFSLFDNIAKSISAVVNGISSLLSGVKEIPLILNKVISFLPSEVMSIFLLGLSITVMLRFLGR